MKTTATIALAVTTTLTAAVFSATSAQAAPGGTDILHFQVVVGMTNNGVEANADGMVLAEQKKQGNANNQKFSIAVTGLSTNTTYELVAVVDDDTNLVDVAAFTTDKKGKAVLNYSSLGNGHGGGHNNSALPAALNPVSLIREIDVVNSNLQAVLTADVTTPDRLDYLIKRNLSNGGVKAELMLHANTHQTEFHLTATGLTPSTNYFLAFNSEIVQTNSSTSKGKLNINSLVEVPPVILDVRDIELLDNSSNVVLQTQLP